MATQEIIVVLLNKQDSGSASCNLGHSSACHLGGLQLLTNLHTQRFYVIALSFFLAFLHSV